VQCRTSHPYRCRVECHIVPTRRHLEVIHQMYRYYGIATTMWLLGAPPFSLFPLIHQLWEVSVLPVSEYVEILYFLRVADLLGILTSRSALRIRTWAISYRARPPPPPPPPGVRLVRGRAVRGITLILSAKQPKRIQARGPSNKV
jgi:hypothetical protein